METCADLTSPMLNELQQTLNHLLPALQDLLSVLADGNPSTSTKIDELTAVMTGIVDGLESVTEALKALPGQIPSMDPLLFRLGKMEDQMTRREGLERINAQLLQHIIGLLEGPP